MLSASFLLQTVFWTTQRNATKHVFHVTDHQFTWAFVTRYHGYKCPMSCEADSSCHPFDSPLAQISWTCRKGHGKIWQAYSVRQAYPFESWKFILDREHPVTSWTRWRILQQSRNWITIRDDGWKDSPESTSWEGLRFLRAMAPNGRCFKQVPVRC